MNSQLSRLVYASRNAIEDSGGDLKTELNKILSAARRKNPLSQITGALIFSEDCFAQVLEGPLADVDAVFKAIETDPRHCDLVVLSREPIEQRAFPTWSMAFVQVKERSTHKIGLLAAVTGGGDAQPVTSPPRDLVATLYSLIALHAAEQGGGLAWPAFEEES